MLWFVNHWRVAALIGACLAGLGLYALGKHDGRQLERAEYRDNAIEAERKRAGDDEKLRGLSEYDFCVLALRRRGLPVRECDELRGVAAE